MPSKLQAYREMADHTAKQITGSYREWTAFLTMSGRIYKYPFQEQLMIYAQRPNATACAEYDFWNERMRRYVRRGATGIALIDTTGGRPVLRYVFDVSDTGGKENARRPWLWQYRDEHEKAVSAALEGRFAIPYEGSLADQLEKIAVRLAKEYWNDHRYDILHIVDGSFLAEYDEFNTGAQFRDAATVSMTYQMMSRCGLAPEEHFEHEDFLSVFDFNTPETLYELGTAVSEGSEQVLRQIEVTIKSYEREKFSERNVEHGKQADIHTDRGLSDPQSGTERTDGAAPGQVREAAPDVSEGPPSGNVQPVGADRDAVQSLSGSRGRGERAAGTADAAVGESGGRDGTVEGQRSDAVGRTDEHLQSAGGGDHSDGTGLQLDAGSDESSVVAGESPWGQFTLLPPDIPTQRQQIESIREAERAQAPSASSVSQDEIDAELRRGTGIMGGKLRVYALYQRDISSKEAVAALKKEYGTSGHSHTFLDGTNGFVDYWPDKGMILRRHDPEAEISVRWPKLEKRIRQMIAEGSYLTQAELEKYQSDHLEQAVPEEDQPEENALEESVSEEATPEEVAPEETASVLQEQAAPQPEAPVLTEITDADIDSLLIEDFGSADRKQEIYELYQSANSEDEIERKLPDKFLHRNGEGQNLTAGPCTLADGSKAFARYDYGLTVISRSRGATRTVSFEELARRIRALIDEGRYLSPEELARYTAEHPEQFQAPTTPDSTGVSEIEGAPPEKPGRTRPEVNYRAFSKLFPEIIDGEYRSLHLRAGPSLMPLHVQWIADDVVAVSHTYTSNGDIMYDPEMTVRVDREKNTLEALTFRQDGGLHIYQEVYPEPGKWIPRLRSSLNSFFGQWMKNITEQRYVRETAVAERDGEDVDIFFNEEGTALTADEILMREADSFKERLLRDERYANARMNSDEQNSRDECRAAIDRIVIPMAETNVQFYNAYFGASAAAQRFHDHLFETTYRDAAREQTTLSEPAASEAIVPPPPVPREAVQAKIDAALQEWNGDIASKHAVVRYMKNHARDKDTAAWLKQEYGDDFPAFPVPGAQTDLPWPKVQRRIAQLIQKDEFYTQEERDNFDDIDPVAIREHLESGETNPFVEKVMADVERLAAQEAKVPDLSNQPVSREGDTLTIGDGEATHEIDVTVSEEEWQSIREAIPGAADQPPRDPLAPAYKPGDIVYLDNTAYEITGIGLFDVQLQDPSLPIPLLRSESREWFEQLLRQNDRNRPITEFLPASLERFNVDLRDVLTKHLLEDKDKDYISGWLRSGEGNSVIAHRLSEFYAGRAETLMLGTGEKADYFTSTLSIEVDILDSRDNKIAAVTASWDEVASVLRALYQKELDGFSQEPVRREAVRLEGTPVYQVGDHVIIPSHDHDIDGIIGYIGELDIRIDTGPYAWSNEIVSRDFFEEGLRRDERNAHLFTREVPEQEITGTVPAPEDAPAPQTVSTTVYPGEENRLPFDVVVETLHFDEQAQPEQTFPEQTPPERTPLDAPAANFRIADDHLGEGSLKEKFRRNMEAINTLQGIELEGRSATTAEQEVLSRYVGWGGLPDAFDPDKPGWADEFLELQAALTPEEYASARASCLNAHYTSPAVIREIYEAVKNMGFQQGNILEPSCGVGNFFGLLPEDMAESHLYGVELDSITGRIAQQLYPKAHIEVTGFEKTQFPNDFFDLAIGNVPFGGYQVVDRQYDRHHFFIHDYFFAKTIDKVRPGGVIAYITSNGMGGGTMDKKDASARQYIAQRCDLLGAVRLPFGVFQKNAGTEFGMDLVFLQKRDKPRMPDEPMPEWVETETIEEHDYTSATGERRRGFVTVNRYFQTHPEMMLGTPEIISGPYGPQLICRPREDAPLSEQLREALSHIKGRYREAVPQKQENGKPAPVTIPADPDVKNYSFTVVDGVVYYRENAVMTRQELNAAAVERVKGMIELRDCARRLIDLQLWDSDSLSIQREQENLERLYDAYTAQYGLINDRANRLVFSSDDSYYLLCALEVIDENGRLERKADMFTKRTIRPHKAVTSVGSASEALTVSIAEKAKVDLPYMVRLTGKTEEELERDLTGVLYRDIRCSEAPGMIPQANADLNRFPLVTADEYLSGNVRRKLRMAKAMAEAVPPEQRERVQQNITALEAAQPKDLEASEIEVRLGATWIDKAYIQQFMYEVLNTPYYLRKGIRVSYSPYTAAWMVSGKSSVSSNDVAAYSTFGTSRANAYMLLEDSLNLRDVRIYDTVEDADGKEKRVLNGKETTLAAQKQQALRDAFKDWIWKDPERRQTLVRQYNEEMNSTRPREYDGSSIVFSGMNPEIQLKPHQLNAIAHVLYGGNTLLAHEVGAGKTFEMVAAAMESKRLGLCHKSMIVVPNHLTEQWASEFLRLYPAANILVTNKKDFEKQNRKKFCARIVTGNYDAVIIGHSQFEKIPISQERRERLLQEQIFEITDGIQEVKESGGERFTVKQLERTKKQLEASLVKLQAADKKDDVITFEELGVDRLFVDESDTYKNLFLYTKMRNVAGLSTTSAQKSSDMFEKCRYLDEITGGRGTIFATGTPVSNSMTEVYSIQRYLQYDRLREMGMSHFDQWASHFGETVTALELAPEGTGYRARTRFAKFFNLPELMNVFKEVADIKTADQLDLPTPEVEYHTIASKPTEIQQAMVKELSERAGKVHNGSVDPHIDNMLKITSDGRKLGLDQRIINPNFPDEPGTKVNRCVDEIMRFWREGQEDKLTQLVFSDISTPQAPSSGEKTASVAAQSEPEPPFTIYADIKRKLIEKGMPAEQIAFIHDAKTDVQKKELFAKVRSGQVRVLIGSTQKMGAGTNVQDRLIALHDLDCPWRPRDLIQRKGRIERQGNQNEKVHVCRYVTESTFDAYLWQTVEKKQKFISQIMTSKSPVRSCDDVDEAALSYAEIKALCAGDPRIKERMELDVDVSKLKIMKADHQSQRFRMEDRLLKYFPEQISQTQGFIKGMEADMETLAAHPHPAGLSEGKKGFAGMTIGGTVFKDKTEAGKALIEACAAFKGDKPVEIGTYRGFTISLSKSSMFHDDITATLQGKMSHKTELSSDVLGNLLRIDHALEKMPDRLDALRTNLDELYKQQEATKGEVGKPFPREEELRQKSARLAELDAQLNIDVKPPQEEQAIAKSARPSVLAKLERPLPPRERKVPDMDKPKHREAER